MGNSDLRPLSLGEVLDIGFTLGRQLYPVLVSILLVTQGIPAILSVYQITSRATLFGNPMLVIGNTLFSTLMTGLSVAAISLVISSRYLGERLGARDALRQAMPFLSRVVVTGFLVYLAVFIGFILLFIPGIIAACGLALATIVVVLENSPNARMAMQRSWSLTRGYRMKVFGVLVVSLVVATLPAMALGVVTGMLGQGGTVDEPSVLNAVGGPLLTLLIYPFLFSLFTVIYYDLRVRKEGFDLEVLAGLFERR